MWNCKNYREKDSRQFLKKFLDQFVHYASFMSVSRPIIDHNWVLLEQNCCSCLSVEKLFSELILFAVITWASCTRFSPHGFVLRWTVKALSWKLNNLCSGFYFRTFFSVPANIWLFDLIKFPGRDFWLIESLWWKCLEFH